MYGILCHIWANTPRCDLELLDKLQKQICMTVGLSFAAALGLAHRRNVASLSLFYRYYFSNVLQNRCNWFHFFFLEEGLLVILIDCTIFLSRFLDVTRMSMPTVSFFAQLDWNSLPIKCFPLTYDLSGFKSRINRHLLTVSINRHLSAKRASSRR